jgi:hypothetical protein
MEVRVSNSIPFYRLTPTDQLKRQKLFELGKAIRRFGQETPKKHGSYWKLKLPNGLEFQHDDYNNSVKAVFPNGSNFYFGMDFGGFTGSHVTIEQYEAAILAVMYTKN